MIKQSVTRAQFLHYAQHSPKLLKLEADIRAHAMRNQSRRTYCANQAWLTLWGFKSRLIKLVGDCATDPQLAGSEVYDTCHSYLWGMLPSCRHEGECK